MSGPSYLLTPTLSNTFHPCEPSPLVVSGPSGGSHPGRMKYRYAGRGLNILTNPSAQWAGVVASHAALSLAQSGLLFCSLTVIVSQVVWWVFFSAF